MDIGTLYTTHLDKIASKLGGIFMKYLFRYWYTLINKAKFYAQLSISKKG